MAIVREKSLTQMKLQGACPTHARTHVKAGVHAIVIDEPRSRGGTDMAIRDIEFIYAGGPNVSQERQSAALARAEAQISRFAA